MCLNCGCGQPNEDHGNRDNITAKDLAAAAEANGQSLRESAQHIIETVELLESSGRDSRGLAQPAGPEGARSAPRGTPASES
jgi:hypothetical protein